LISCPITVKMMENLWTFDAVLQFKLPSPKTVSLYTCPELDLTILTGFLLTF
jgi:hypothetical protein